MPSLDSGPPGHVNAADFSGIEVPSIVRDGRGRSCESPVPRSGPAGRRAQMPHAFTGVRRHRPGPGAALLLAGGGRGHVRRHDFCRWMSPRARWQTSSNIPVRGRGLSGTLRSRGSSTAVGRLPGTIGSCLSIGAVAGARGGQGQSENPTLGVPGGDCSHAGLAPTSIAPSTSCRGSSPLARSGETRVRRVRPPGAVQPRSSRLSSRAARCCGSPGRPTSSRGRCDGGHPRRIPPLTGPRCFPSHVPFAGERGQSGQTARGRRRGAQRLFHHPDHRAGEHPQRGWMARRAGPRRVASHCPVDLPQRPE